MEVYREGTDGEKEILGEKRTRKVKIPLCRALRTSSDSTKHSEMENRSEKNERNRQKKGEEKPHENSFNCCYQEEPFTRNRTDASGVKMTAQK